MARGAKTGGRQKGTPNKTTAAFKDAITAVYGDLQETCPDREHGHFFAWAKDNQTEFYKLASKLIPVQVAGDDDNPINHVHRIELVAAGQR
jgi:hypothetical protein